VLEQIKRYSEDSSQKRPLNFLLLASPGAGKSHFIRCIAAKLGTQKIGAIVYNMVGLQRHEDLIPPLDAARNLKVEDKIPLLFLDEFDSEIGNFPLLLPLLWDGELTLGQHDLKLGKVVIVLAGSDPRLPQVIKAANNLGAEPLADKDSHHPKLIDLFSRINGGVLRIPDLSIPSRRPDKVCIAVGLLRRRFGPSLKSAPLPLIRFIASTEFRYAVRSMAHLIDLIPHTPGLSHLVPSKLDLPLDTPQQLKSSSLAYHLVSQDQALGIVNSWKESLRVNEQVPVSSETLDSIATRSRGIFDNYFADYLITKVASELQKYRSSVRAGRRK